MVDQITHPSGLTVIHLGHVEDVLPGTYRDEGRGTDSAATTNMILEISNGLRVLEISSDESLEEACDALGVEVDLTSEIEVRKGVYRYLVIG